MKKLLVFAIIVITLLSCNSSKELAITNLKKSIEGEATASAKYTAFANQAAKDSLYEIEALFRAISLAEIQHVENLQALLVSLGEKQLKPDIGKYTVANTVQNLQDAINGETIEFSVMYPTYAAEANKAGQKNIADEYNRIIDAEICHSKIFGETLAQLSQNTNVTAAYYVCPICGNVILDHSQDRCNICGALKSEFIAVHATQPLTDAIPVAPIPDAK